MDDAFEAHDQWEGRMAVARLLSIGVFSLALASCGQGSPSNDQFAQQEQAELEERIATVINLNGHLCAQVRWIEPTTSTGEYAGEYQVICEEFRDPAKASTEHNLVVYMVDPDTKLYQGSLK